LVEFDLTHYKVVELSLSLNSFGRNEFESLISFIFNLSFPNTGSQSIGPT